MCTSMVVCFWTIFVLMKLCKNDAGSTTPSVLQWYFSFRPPSPATDKSSPPKDDVYEAIGDVEPIEETFE